MPIVQLEKGSPERIKVSRRRRRMWPPWYSAQCHHLGGMRVIADWDMNKSVGNLTWLILSNETVGPAT